MKIQRKDLTFRVFVSSTFSDFVEERNVLHEKVFRSLTSYCLQRGATFQAIDLRWGVAREASLDQQTMKICLDELRRCQVSSPKPNFVILIGDRYGWVPLPRKIGSTRYEELLEGLTPAERDELNEWYQLDENALPPVHVLLPRKGSFTAPSEWQRVEGRLAHLIRKRVAHGDSGWEEFLTSATHQEILKGALEIDGDGEPQQHIFCGIRTISGLPGDETARDFQDVLEDGRLDTQAKGRLRELKEEIRRCLPTHHVHDYEAVWQDGGPRYDLGQLCNDLEAHLKKCVDEELAAFTELSAFEREQQSHADFARERGGLVLGRDEILNRIQQYVFDDEPGPPLVISGDPGSGKTAVLARAWLNVQGSSSQLVSIARFIGATPESSELPLLLSGVCQQWGSSLGNPGATSTVASDLTKEFHARLATPPEGTVVAIFLDALDQLNPTEDAPSLHWLPLREELPKGVKLIVSVSKLPGSPTYERVRRIRGEEVIELNPLSETDGEALLSLWLAEAGRTLQPEQRHALMDGFAACRAPLYLKLATGEATGWTSIMEPPHRMATDVPGLISSLFDRLERPEQHGLVLVSRALVYLTAARRGLSETEMLAILSADPEVMADYRRRSPDSPETSQLPFVIWSRLFSELQTLLTVRSYQGTRLIDFYHREVREAAETRYLAGDARRQGRAGLIQFFVDQSPFLAPGITVSERRAGVNGRFVDEYPWLLAAAAGEMAEYGRKLEELLTDLSFIEAKCLAGAIYDLESDYVRAFQVIAQNHGDARLDLMREYATGVVAYARARRESAAGHQVPFPQAIASFGGGESLSAGNAFTDFSQFVSTHAHQLADFPFETVQFARRYLSKSSVVEASARLSRARTLLEFELDPPSEISSLSGGCWLRTLRHEAKSVALDATGMVAVTAGGRTGSVRFWDLTTGAPIRVASEHDDDVDHIAMTPDGRVAISGGGTWSIMATGGTMDGMCVMSPILGYNGRPMKITPDYALRVWDARVGDCTGILPGHTDAIEALALSADGATAVSSSRDLTLRHWDVESGQCLHLMRPSVLLKSLLLDAPALLCIGVCDHGRLHLWEVGTWNWSLRQPPTGQKFLAAALTPDGRFLTAVTEKALLGWEIDRDEPIFHREISESFDRAFCISPDGRYLFGSINKRDLLIYDLQDIQAEPRKITGAGSEHAVAVTPDARFLLNAQGGETRLWDLAAILEPEEARKESYHSLFGPKPASPQGSRLWQTGNDSNAVHSLYLNLQAPDGKSAPLQVPLASASSKAFSEAAFLDSGRHLLTQYKDEAEIELWNGGDGSRLRSVAAEKPSELTAARYADRFGFVNDAHQIQIWSSSGPLYSWDEHVQPVGALGISHEGTVALSVGGEEISFKESETKKDSDFNLRVWDLHTGRLRHKLPTFAMRSERVTVDRHGWGAATLSHEMFSSGGVVEFWDLEFGLHRGSEFIAPVLIGVNSDHNLDVAPDGATFLVGAFNNEMKRVQIFHPGSRTCESLLHSNLLFSRVAFARSGRIIVGRSFGLGQLRVWDFVSGDLLGTCMSSPDDGGEDFSWVDGEGNSCICPNRTGGVEILRVRNLPPSRLSLNELLLDLHSSNPRRQLVALWCGIDHPPARPRDGDRIADYHERLLDLLVDSTEGPLTESLRQAAYRAAQRADAVIIPLAIERLRREPSWQGAGALALLVGSRTANHLTSQAGQALKLAADHPDTRVRKRVALVLDRYHTTDFAHQLLGDLKKQDPVVAEFLELVQNGNGSAHQLDRTARNHEPKDREPRLSLCPTSLSEMNATNTFFEGIEKLARVGRTVLRGHSHGYFEVALLQQQAERARKAQDLAGAAQRQCEIDLLGKAHQFEKDCPESHRAYFARLAALTCVCVPVKRVLAGLVSDSMSDEQFSYLVKCLDYVEAGFELFDDPEFLTLRERLQDIEDDRELIQALGVKDAGSLSIGLGPRDWREYSQVVVFDVARMLYCLSNEMIQSLYDFWIEQERDSSKWRPRQHSQVLAERLMCSVGWGAWATQLRTIYTHAFGPVDPYTDSSSLIQELKFEPLMPEEALASQKAPVVKFPLAFRLAGILISLALSALCGGLSTWLFTLHIWWWAAAVPLALVGLFLLYKTCRFNRLVTRENRRWKQADWNCYGRAIHHWKAGHLQEALRELDGLPEAFLALPNELAAALMLVERAAIREQAGLPQEAMGDYHQASTLLEKLKGIKGSVRSLIESIQNRCVSGQFLTLRRHRLDSQRLTELLSWEFNAAKASGDNEAAQLWGSELVRLFVDAGNLKGALSLCAGIPRPGMDRYLELERKAAYLDGEDLQTALRNQSLILGTKEEWDESITQAEELVSSAEKTRDTTITILALIRLATAQANRGNFAQACHPLGRAILLSQNAELGSTLQRALILRGEIACAEQDWDALQQIATKVEAATPGHPSGRVFLAQCFEGRGDREQARETWKLIRHQAEQEGDEMTAAVALTHLGALTRDSQVELGHALFGVISSLTKAGKFTSLRRIYRRLSLSWPEFAEELARQLLHEAETFEKEGAFNVAADAYNWALLVDPENSNVLTRVAWFRATCPDSRVRSARAALLLAEQACKLTSWREWAMIDTYATALAEDGNFTRAVQVAQKALELAPSDGARAQVSEALARYREGLPMRERDDGLAGRCTAEQQSILMESGYPLEAYDFLLEGLKFAVECFVAEFAASQDDSTQPIHVTVKDLCMGLCELAKRKFGGEALPQFKRWNIANTSDFGVMTFTLVQAGLMSATEEDRPEQFEGLFNLEDMLKMQAD